MLTRYIYYLLVENVAVIVTTIEIYLFFLLSPPPPLMPSCGRRSLLFCARTRFSYSSSIYLTINKTTKTDSDDKRRHHSLVLVYWEMRANACWPYSFSQSVTHSHTNTLTSIKINIWAVDYVVYFGVLSSSVSDAHTNRVCCIHTYI